MVHRAVGDEGYWVSVSEGAGTLQVEHVDIRNYRRLRSFDAYGELCETLVLVYAHSRVQVFASWLLLRLNSLRFSEAAARPSLKLKVNRTYRTHRYDLGIVIKP